MNDIQDNFYLMASLEHAQDVAEAVRRQDFVRLERLHVSAPTRNNYSQKQDAVEMGRNAVEALASGNVVSLKPQSVELKPLDLVFAPGTILALAADSGHGKSALGEQILLDLSQQGAMVLDISVELDETHKRYRYFQHIGGENVGPRAYYEGTINAAELVPVVAQFMHLKPPSGSDPGIPRRLFVESNPSTINEVLVATRTFIEEHKIYAEACKAAGMPYPGPPIIMVDFLQAVDVPEIQIGEVAQLMRVVSELYSLAKSRQIAMIWTSQLRKQDSKKKLFAKSIRDEIPQIEELEGSKRLINYAHQVLTLYKPDVGFESTNHYKIYAHMPKVRIGPTRTLEGLFTGDTMNFDFDPISIKKKL